MVTEEIEMTSVNKYGLAPSISDLNPDALTTELGRATIELLENKIKTNQDIHGPGTKTFLGIPRGPNQKFDDEQVERFLRFYAQTGRKMDACRAAGVSYVVVRDYEKDHPEFAELVDMARMEFLNHLERETYRRAVEGVPKAITNKDGILGYEMVYSDKLLELMLRKIDPNGYSHKSEQQVTHTGGVLVSPAPAAENTTTLPIEDVEYIEE